MARKFLSGIDTSAAPVSIAGGGTGAGTASAARANLGLVPGTAAGNVVQLDGSARLPAVDGSQLTNLPSSGTSFTVGQIVALGYGPDSLS